MPAALAGVLLGASMGVVFDVLLVQAMGRLARDPRGWLRTALEQMALPRVAIPIAVLSHALWTLGGLVMGVAYDLQQGRGAPSGLGSPSLPYTAATLAVAAAMALVAATKGRRILGWMAPVPLLFAATFGWGLPFLAG